MSAPIQDKLYNEYEFSALISQGTFDENGNESFLQKAKLGEAKMHEVITNEIRPNLDIAPANIYLSRAEPKLMSQMMREHKLKTALNEVRDQYDYVIIDSPPSLGLLTINALVAAEQVIIPVPCDVEGLVGLKLLLETINEIKAQANPDLSVLGIVVTRYENHPREQSAVQDGAKAVIAKPFGGNELIAAIARLIGPPEKSPISQDGVLPACT